MNVANLELCKELYRLSGWNPEDGEKHHEMDEDNLYTITPAYDLGFLWRKFEELGNDLNVGYHDVSDNMTFAFGERGTGSLLEGFGTRIEVEPHENIEDYFCDFFIELFKQGILK